MANRPTPTPPLPEQDYRQIFDAATDAIFIHDALTGAILDINDKMLEMYGYSRQEGDRSKIGKNKKTSKIPGRTVFSMSCNQ